MPGMNEPNNASGEVCASCYLVAYNTFGFVGYTVLCEEIMLRCIGNGVREHAAR